MFWDLSKQNNSGAPRTESHQQRRLCSSLSRSHILNSLTFPVLFRKYYRPIQDAWTNVNAFHCLRFENKPMFLVCFHLFLFWTNSRWVNHWTAWCSPSVLLHKNTLLSGYWGDFFFWGVIWWQSILCKTSSSELKASTAASHASPGAVPTLPLPKCSPLSISLSVYPSFSLSLSLQTLETISTPCLLHSFNRPIPLNLHTLNLISSDFLWVMACSQRHWQHQSRQEAVCFVVPPPPNTHTHFLSLFTLFLSFFSSLRGCATMNNTMSNSRFIFAHK